MEFGAGLDSVEKIFLLCWESSRDSLVILPVAESLYRLSNLCCYCYSIVITQMSNTCSMQRLNRNTNKILIGIPHGKRSIGISRYKWEHYIKMHLKQVRC